MKHPIVAAIVISTLFFCACKKAKDPNETIKDTLLGSWIVTYAAIDENENGTIDTDEIDNTGAGSVFSFNKEGTGTISEVVDTEPQFAYSFNWGFANNNKSLMITTQMAPDEAMVFNIDKLTNTDMILNYASDGTWIIFKKQ